MLIIRGNVSYSKVKTRRFAKKKREYNELDIFLLILNVPHGVERPKVIISLFKIKSIYI